MGDEDNLKKILKKLGEGHQVMDAVHTYDELPLSFGSVSQQEELLDRLNVYKKGKKDPTKIFDDINNYFTSGTMATVLTGIESAQGTPVGAYLPAAPVDMTSALYPLGLVAQTIEQGYDALKKLFSEEEPSPEIVALADTGNLEYRMKVCERLNKQFPGEENKAKREGFLQKYVPEWFHSPKEKEEKEQSIPIIVNNYIKGSNGSSSSANCTNCNIWGEYRDHITGELTSERKTGVLKETAYRQELERKKGDTKAAEAMIPKTHSSKKTK